MFCITRNTFFKKLNNPKKNIFKPYNELLGFQNKNERNENSHSEMGTGMFNENIQ